jgi:ComF family protein
MAAALAGLFPDRCALCGLPSESPYPLCRPCARELQPNTGCCPRCAIPLPPAATAGDGRLCGQCLAAPPAFDRTLVPWLYCERLAYLIQCWKFRGERRLTPLLAALWLERVGAIPEVDVIVPVPLHWRRLWQRGFNQSGLLCRALLAAAPAGSRPAIDQRGVRRNRPTAAQATMGAGARRDNLRGAFTVRRRYDNLRLAIVDDVLTTGATATAMAVALRRAGAGHVQLWCLARTPAPGG